MSIFHFGTYTHIIIPHINPHTIDILYIYNYIHYTYTLYTDIIIYIYTDKYHRIHIHILGETKTMTIPGAECWNCPGAELYYGLYVACILRRAPYYSCQSLEP